MGKIPYFPFYPGDWLSSQTIMLMTYEQRGIYIHLLAHSWLTDGCTIPTDKRLLQKLCPGAKWKNIKAVVESSFITHGSSVVQANPRLLVERSEAEIKSQKAREAYKHTKRFKKLQSNDNRTIDRTIIYSDSDSDSESYKEESKTLVQKEDLNEGFKIFWKTYPKKQGKEPARKKWMVLKPDAELLSEMLIAINLQKQTEQWIKDNGQFIPMPITWLNQKRWEDEKLNGGMSRAEYIAGVCRKPDNVAGSVYREDAERSGHEIVEGQAVEISEVET